MAHPIGFPQANCILARPPGVSAEDCTSLECYRGNGEVISKYQFSDEEIAELKRTNGKAYVIVMGLTQPPIALTALDPFATDLSDKAREALEKRSDYSKAHVQADKILKFLTRQIWLDRCAQNNPEATKALADFLLSSEYKDECPSPSE